MLYSCREAENKTEKERKVEPEYWRRRRKKKKKERKKGRREKKKKESWWPVAGVASGP